VQTGFDDHRLRTSFNTGAGFAQEYQGIDDLVADIDEPDTFIKLAMPIDFNADGQQDLLMPMPNSGDAPSWTILQSNGRVGDGTFDLVDPGLPFEALLVQGRRRRDRERGGGAGRGRCGEGGGRRFCKRNRPEGRNVRSSGSCDRPGDAIRQNG
jgi:hypothetical protein